MADEGSGPAMPLWVIAFIILVLAGLWNSWPYWRSIQLGVTGDSPNEAYTVARPVQMLPPPRVAVVPTPSVIPRGRPADLSERAAAAAATVEPAAGNGVGDAGTPVVAGVTDLSDRIAREQAREELAPAMTSGSQDEEGNVIIIELPVGGRCDCD